MDLDATLKSLPLTPETIEKAIQDICATGCGNNVNFSYTAISPIRDNDIYGGYHVMLNAKYGTILTPLSINISTGDVITPTPRYFHFC